MRKQLEHLIKEQKFVSLFFDSHDWDVFNFGRVISVSIKIVCVQTFDKRGEYSGYRIRRLEDLSKIEMDGGYERKLEHIVSDQNPKTNVELEEKLKEIQHIRTALHFIAETGDNCLIWMDNDEDIMGAVQSVDGDTFTIRQAAGFTDSSRTVIALVDDIVGIDFDTKELRVHQRYPCRSFL